MPDRNRAMFDLHCHTCTKNTGVGKCGVNHEFMHVPTFTCPLGKWFPVVDSKNSTHVLLCTQDLAQGGITSLIHTMCQYLPANVKLTIVYASDFKFDEEKVAVIRQYATVLQRDSVNFDALMQTVDVLTFAFVWETNNYEPLIPVAKKRYTEGRLRLVAQSHGECQYTTRSTRYQSEIFKQIGDYYTGFAFTPKGASELEFFGCQHVERMIYPVMPVQGRVHIPPSKPFQEWKRPYRFLYFGRFDPIKQIDKCAALVDNIRQRHRNCFATKNATLTVVGDGWAKPQIEESLKPYKHFVTIESWRSSPQMTETILDHHMFLCQSTFEAGPLSSIECLTANLPVFSSKTGCYDVLENVDPRCTLFSTEPYLYEHMCRTQDEKNTVPRLQTMLRYRDLFDPKTVSKNILFKMLKSEI